MAQASSRFIVPRKGGMTAPRPSIIARASWPSEREDCQRAFVKSGTSGMSQTPRPSMPWHRMQYRLYKPMTTRFSSSGLRIQYQVPPTSPNDSISDRCPSQPCRQRLKIPACESRVPMVISAKNPPASIKNPLIAKTLCREPFVVFIGILAKNPAICLPCRGTAMKALLGIPPSNSSAAGSVAN